MKTLGIDFQEGFKNDDVVVKMDGREIYRQGNMSTKMVLGYAQILRFQVREGTVEVMISLPRRALEKKVHVQISADTYMGVSLTAGGLETFLSSSPFFYQ